MACQEAPGLPSEDVLLRNFTGLQPSVAPCVGSDHVLAAGRVAALHEVHERELVPILVKRVGRRFRYRVFERRLSNGRRNIVS